MEKILIVGLDTIAGANLAAVYRKQCEVGGICRETRVTVEGCTTLDDSADDALRIIRGFQPDRIVYNIQNFDSGWDRTRSYSPEKELVGQAKVWAEATEKTKSPITVLSSAFVMTGPWMFHDEESTRFCPSPQARAILAAECEFLKRSSRTLIVRTHPFGWSPLGEDFGFAADLLAKFRIAEASPIDCIRHSSPILATDLATALEPTINSDSTGVIHLGGSERINPFRFANMLADQFGYHCSVMGTADPVENRTSQFGAGESSLLNARAKHELQLVLPMIESGIQRFHEQGLEDFRDQFQCQGVTARNLVA